MQALLRALEEESQAIRALSIKESADAALVRVICSNSDVARESLRAASFAFSESDLIAIHLPKRKTPPLIAVCSALLAAEINVHYAYPFLTGPGGPALAIYVDDMTLATQLLMKKGFTLIAESDLRK